MAPCSGAGSIASPSTPKCRQAQSRCFQQNCCPPKSTVRVPICVMALLARGDGPVSAIFVQTAPSHSQVSLNHVAIDAATKGLRRAQPAYAHCQMSWRVARVDSGQCRPLEFIPLRPTPKYRSCSPQPNRQTAQPADARCQRLCSARTVEEDQCRPPKSTPLRPTPKYRS